jgi:H(+)-translocating pyrophosphatase
MGEDGMELGTTVAIVYCACAIGLIWAAVNYLQVKAIQLDSGSSLEGSHTAAMIEIGAKISDGAKEFLVNEYKVCAGFVLLMFFVVLGFVEKFKTAFSAMSFLVGAVTSMICGAIGMMIATYSNYRTTYCASKSLALGFQTAYRAGCVMGFALVSISLFVLMTLIIIYNGIKGCSSGSDSKCLGALFEGIAGYGLGGSTVALFGRVGGGIYTKAADVGADLVGKVEKDLPEDSPKNPATIADNVGDNVGDIAGMGADLFGSFAEATCAALVISSDSLTVGGVSSINYLMYPLTSSAMGIVACLLTSIVAIYIASVDEPQKIESTLKWQLIISTVLLAGGLAIVVFASLPSSFELGDKKCFAWQAYLCSLAGLVSGLIIGWFTEYMTSHSYTPVRELAEACRSGAATNVIYGLALGYLSTIVPVICIALTAYLSNYLLGYYGVALAALGMLSNLPVCLAIDGYGPISDNAGGIAEMCEIGEHVRERTDALDAAGNTTAAIGKGFAIGSAALVSLALYGGFLHNSKLEKATEVSLTQPLVFSGLMVGAMLPYLFSAFTMKSVGKAALGMVEEIRKQIRENPGILTGEV